MGFLEDTMIPTIIFLVFGFIILRGMSKPLGEMWRWISGLFNRSDGGADGGEDTLYYE